jgi:alkylation response protein AidB-like acyl-CoA dehydrogenase
MSSNDELELYRDMVLRFLEQEAAPSIYAGTSEIMREVIARGVLGR